MLLVMYGGFVGSHVVELLAVQPPAKTNRERSIMNTVGAMPKTVARCRKRWGCRTCATGARVEEGVTAGRGSGAEAPLPTREMAAKKDAYVNRIRIRAVVNA